MWTVAAILAGVPRDNLPGEPGVPVEPGVPLGPGHPEPGLPLEPGLAGLLRAMGPDPRAVHAVVAPPVGSPVVDELAAADYGQDFREHRKALNALLARGDPPERLEWVPHEVLVLTLGHSGAATDLYIGSLLLAAVTPYQDPLVRLPPFLRAALDLGGAELVAARRFLAWCRLESPGDWPVCVDDLPYLTFGVLLLSVMVSPPPSDETLCGLAAGVVEELDRSVFDGEWIGRQEPPLIGRRPKKPAKVWRELAARVLVDGPLAGTGVGGRLAVLGRVICREQVLPVEDLYELFS